MHRKMKFSKDVIEVSGTRKLIAWKEGSSLSSPGRTTATARASTDQELSTYWAFQSASKAKWLNAWFSRLPSLFIFNLQKYLL